MYAMEEERNWPHYPTISWLSCLMSDVSLASLMRFQPAFRQLTKQQQYRCIKIHINTDLKNGEAL